jgi:hypothetical protein
MTYFYNSRDIDINYNQLQGLTTENLNFIGGVQNEFDDKINNITKNYDNIKDNKKLNNIKDNNLIKIQEKSIRFNDILIEDLDCNFKINANTKNLYCGVLDDDYEPSDEYKQFFNLKINNKYKYKDGFINRKK